MQSLTVPGKLDSLKPIADFVITASAQVGLDKKAAYKLRLAVDEIATNIILYGYEEAGCEGDIIISAVVDDQQLEIVLEDDAILYDPQQTQAIETAELQRPLAERQMGGLGVYLAIQGVDQFRYERAGNRNRNIFNVKRARASRDCI
ncbi:MAG: anti-sigma regulatory factor [Pegethrix bostrychoides GSE-TBD4-15B]|jgi:anti-sigma regulatory factor (Ser/Thr protein kinase)|uniref:Anti-sigma regulatory factor n=1 Tax=Pegethrix bostrychoides GSE-TBD4-15B TaxID=2839662 RepID=A0A951PCU9_9CYAN|nr:anti-sigma regulatory factor [Pegethrix bostrychoides GSE-TBD4-15B]